jgi:hypothetical protein
MFPFSPDRDQPGHFRLRKMDVKGSSATLRRNGGADASVDRSRGSWRPHARQRGNRNGRGDAEDSHVNETRVNETRVNHGQSEDSG